MLDILLSVIAKTGAECRILGRHPQQYIPVIACRSQQLPPWTPSDNIDGLRMLLQRCQVVDLAILAGRFYLP